MPPEEQQLGSIIPLEFGEEGGGTDEQGGSGGGAANV